LKGPTSNGREGKERVRKGKGVERGKEVERAVAVLG